MGARRSVLLVAAGLLAAGLGLAGSSAHVLRPAELATVDARFSVRGAQRPPAGVVVVGLDARSLDALGVRPPIPRRLHARMLDRLRAAGARVIAYDLQFTEPSPSVRDDNALFRALQRTPGTVLGTTIVGPHGETSGNLAAANLAATGARAASTNYPTDGGVIRRLRFAERGLPSLPVAAARAAGARITGSGTAWIDFAGPPGTVEQRSFSDVLAGRVDPGAFRGRVVVVGAVDPILQDVHATAVGEGMPGPEINAEAIATLLRGLPLRDPAGWLAFALIVAAGLLVPLAALRLAGLRWLAVAGLLAVAYPVAAQLAFDGGTVLPVAAPATAWLAAVLGTLAVAHATDLRERRRLRAAFARFVGPDVVDEVVGQAGGEPRLGGVERDATVLFCDLRGFTMLAESRSAAGVIDLLNRYLTAMSDAILDAGGTVVAYMGDGIMAVFGAPLPLPDHADRALRAARAMLGPRLAALNAEVPETLRIGIGLCSGTVLSGNVGSERRLEYAAVGDTTNTAARLQALTKARDCAILIAESTRAALHDEPADLVEVGELEVRGRSERLLAWTIRA